MSYPVKAKKVAYVVLRGRVPGIYDTWDEARSHVDGFDGACFKGYYTYEAAIEVWERWEYGGENIIQQRRFSRSGRPTPRSTVESRDRLSATREYAVWLVQNFSGPDGRGTHTCNIK